MTSVLTCQLTISTGPLRPLGVLMILETSDVLVGLTRAKAHKLYVLLQELCPGARISGVHSNAFSSIPRGLEPDAPSTSQLGTSRSRPLCHEVFPPSIHHSTSISICSSLWLLVRQNGMRYWRHSLAFEDGKCHWASVTPECSCVETGMYV